MFTGIRTLHIHEQNHYDYTCMFGKAISNILLVFGATFYLFGYYLN
ncbi:MAG: hypothetical protein AMDU2_EPLC00007G0081 [Thermoplasmatales archaeon E-plasma]|jgi:hypothetical protein|nr:MAG: hypothetical protein AMDU2_EPLC00007G0081 [Thermoplasmatales archaeon E-plasma]EQB69918.1 MAG: hypothetical protein AMDU5_GPLC00001G0136 [Thermoplasmatales archaeon Gpl]